MNGQWLKPRLDVNLRPASHTYMQIREAPMNELLDEVKDYLSRGRHPRFGTLIECVRNDESWVSSRDREHLLEMADQDSLAGLLGALPV